MEKENEVDGKPESTEGDLVPKIRNRGRGNHEGIKRKISQEKIG